MLGAVHSAAVVHQQLWGGCGHFCACRRPYSFCCCAAAFLRQRHPSERACKEEQDARAIERERERESACGSITTKLVMLGLAHTTLWVVRSFCTEL